MSLTSFARKMQRLDLSLEDGGLSLGKVFTPSKPSDWISLILTERNIGPCSFLLRTAKWWVLGFHKKESTWIASSLGSGRKMAPQPPTHLPETAQKNDRQGQGKWPYQFQPLKGTPR